MNADVYTEHAHEVFSACYAPSGFYICSGGMTYCSNIVLNIACIAIITVQQHILKLCSIIGHES